MINPDVYEAINVGIKANSKMIEVGSHITPEEKSKIKKLVMDFKDVFAWSYNELKAYKDDVI